MLIPSAQAALLRNYQTVLFHDETHPVSERRYVFYLLLRPLLQWLNPILVGKGLEPNEVESEIFLLCSSIYDKFNPAKSSIVPYLEKQIPWSIEHLARRFKKKEATCYSAPEQYELEEEFYWTVPSILTEDRYIGKVFTRSMRHVIYNILTSDDQDLTTEALARKMQINRLTMRKNLNEIREQLEKWQIRNQ
jgi:hypothetical protein